jgi:hypothetical protein
VDVQSVRSTSEPVRLGSRRFGRCRLHERRCDVARAISDREQLRCRRTRLAADGRRGSRRGDVRRASHGRGSRQLDGHAVRLRPRLLSPVAETSTPTSTSWASPGTRCRSWTCTRGTGSTT